MSIRQEISVGHNITIYYDGECPLCRNYSRALRLGEAAESLNLIDMRNEPDLVARFTEMGMDIDEGFIVAVDDHLLHGSEALNALALMSSPSDLFNRMNVALFSRPRVANLIYPWLVRGRAVLLYILGRSKIMDSPDTAN